MTMTKIFMTDFNNQLKVSREKLFNQEQVESGEADDYLDKLRKLATDNLRVCMSVVEV